MDYFYAEEIISECDSYHINVLREDGAENYFGFSISIRNDNKELDCWDNTEWIIDTLIPYLKEELSLYTLEEDTRDALRLIKNKDTLLSMLERAIDLGMLKVETSSSMVPAGITNEPSIEGTGSDKAQRFNEGKLDWTLVDYKSIEPLVQAMTYGATKYARENWKLKCDDPMQHIQSAFRHLIAITQGEDIDPESKVEHLGHVMANMMMYKFQKDAQ